MVLNWNVSLYDKLIHKLESNHWVPPRLFNHLLQYLLFNLVKVLIDLIVANQSQFDFFLLSVGLTSTFRVNNSGQVLYLLVHSPLVDWTQLFQSFSQTFFWNRCHLGNTENFEFSWFDELLVVSLATLLSINFESELTDLVLGQLLKIVCLWLEAHHNNQVFTLTLN